MKKSKFTTTALVLKARASWKKHEQNCHVEDSIPFSEFLSEWISNYEQYGFRYNYELKTIVKI